MIDWMSWKTWSVVALIVVAAFAIYAFAATQNSPVDTTPSRPATRTVAGVTSSVPGVQSIHMEWLDAQPGTYKTQRNLFSYYEPPPPPPPAPPPPPPDRDKDGVPDFKDNCPDKYNPDQADIDHNGIGDVCQATPVIAPPPPPPPPPTPPPFTYKFIGSFGPPSSLIASFNSNGEIVNVRVGDTIDNKFIIRAIGVESVDVGFVGFPNDVKTRVPLGQ